MQYLINKFTVPGDLVVDPCAGTFSTFKACIKFDKHRRFVGTDKDENAIVHSEDSVIELFAAQIQNQKSDFSHKYGNEVRQAAATVLEEVERKDVQKRADAWHTPRGLVPVQNFPPYIVHYLCHYHNEYDLMHRAHISMNKWTLKWIQRMNSADPKALLAYEASQLMLMVRKSTIKHPGAGNGVFSINARQAGECVAYYYGAIVYGDIGGTNPLLKRYGTGILSCSSDDYNKWANNLGFEFTDSFNNRYDGYVVPAPFCIARYINDPRYRNGDKEKTSVDPDTHMLDETKQSKGTKGTKQNAKNTAAQTKNSQDNHEDVPARRRANVRFQLDSSASSNRSFEKYSTLKIMTIQDISPGEELFVDYGRNYSFT